MSEIAKTKPSKTSTKIKVGVLNLGYEFEKLVPAYLALQLLSNENVKSFKLILNPSSFSKFDDLIVEIYYKNKSPEKFAIQLKHRQSGRDKLNASEEFTGRKSEKQAKNFNIGEYIKGFNKLDQKFRNDYKCVLYTNSHFLNIHENEIYDVTDLTEANNVLNSGKVFQLNDCRSNENAEFFKNFFLFSEQKNVDQLKDSILDTFSRYYKADIQRATCYIDFFGEVRKHNYNDTEITRDQVILKIMDLLISKYVLEVQLKGNKKKTALIEEAIANFDLTVIPKISHNLEENRKPITNKDDINQLITVKAIPSKTSVSISKENNFLISCQLGKKPLFLNVRNDNRDIIYEGIKLTKKLENIKIRIVLIDKNFKKEQFEEFKILQNLADLRSSDELYKKLTTQINISLQGRKIQPIQTFSDFGIYFDKFINLSDIIDSEVLLMGTETEELPQPFIERHLLLDVMTYKILSKICKEGESVLIYCRNSSEFREILLKENANLNVIDLPTYEVSPKQHKPPLIVLADQKSNKYADFTQLTLLENNYLQFGNSKPEANEFSFSHSRLSLVCGEPGTGKTTMMKYLAHQCPLSYWIVTVTLIEMKYFFREETVEQIILKYLKERKGADNQTMEYFWRKKNIIFMMDGLDELDKTEIHTAIKIIQKLSTNYRIIMFCRENLRNSLLKQLNIDCVYSISDLSLDDQKSYINTVLRKNDISKEHVQQILDSVFKSDSKFINLDLLKKPLYLYIFTETLVNYRKFIHTILLTPTKLYSEFIEGKFCHYLRKHKGEYLNPTVIIKRFKRYCLKEYEIAALQTCLMEEDFKRLELKNDKVFVEEIAENDDLGLIPKISNNRFIFFHHTVAEYLSALWFSEHILEISMEKRKMLLNPKYVEIKYFFDRILAEDKPLHLAVLEHSYQDVVTLAETHIKDLDDGGRTAMHLMVSSNRHSSPLHNEDEFQFSSFYQTNQQKIVEKIALHLLEPNPNLLIKDKIFEWNCIQYADASFSLCILEQFSKQVPLEWHYLTNLRRSLETRKGSRPLLHIVIEYNYENIAKILIENNFDLRSVDKNDQTALHEAAFWGRTNIAKLLLQRNIDMEHKNYRGRTALHIASKMGHIEIVELLIENGANVNAQDIFNRTPLNKAAYKGALNVVKLLIEKDADVDSKNLSGYTALHRAALMGHLPVVKCLVENNANIEELNKYCKTPLHLATHAGRENVVEYLVSKGSNINAQDEDKKTPLQLAEEKKHRNIINILRSKAESNNISSVTMSKKSENPLHEAARKNDTEKVKHLISTGTYINQQDDEGNTILHIACQEGHEKLVGYLLQVGADPHITSHSDRSPLHVAVQHGHLKIVETLLDSQYGVLINARDNLGETAAHLAAYKGHFEILKLLIHFGVDDITDNFGTTLFHFAVCGGNTDIMEYLRKRGAKIDAKNDNGETCLIRATRLCCLGGVEYITKNCPEILNEVTIHKKTALHCAAELGYEDILKVIVRAGADTKLEDENKLTALDIAENFNRDSIATFLRTYNSNLK